MFKRPINAEQVRRLSDHDLETFLDLCESRADHGILYNLACDEEVAREERAGKTHRRPPLKSSEDVRWC